VNTPRIILRGITVATLLAVLLVVPQPAHASPFGQGVFSADVPFGSATSISIALGGDVALNLTPSGGQFSGTGSHTVTVTSTDVVGYLLYLRPTTGTNLTNGSATISASSNGSAAALTEGTWGYNTTGSTTNFLGLSNGIAEIKNANGPYKSGDPTTVTYGALTGATQAAGNYTMAVTYTVVAKNP
jgi:hypothetical protein